MLQRKCLTVEVNVSGLLVKDALTKEMEDYVSGYYTNPGSASSQYMPDTSYLYGDPTRIFEHASLNDVDDDFGNLNYYRYII